MSKRSDAISRLISRAIDRNFRPEDLAGYFGEIEIVVKLENGKPKRILVRGTRNFLADELDTSGKPSK